MPDAKGNVDLHIQGTHLKFDGVGYHDQVSPSPFLLRVSSSPTEMASVHSFVRS